MTTVRAASLSMFAASAPAPAATQHAPDRSAPHPANKLPQLTIFFWIMKICATTLGETAGDLLSMTLNIGYLLSSVILIAAFLVTLVAQVRARGYHPLLFWLVILSTSTAGTTISDFMDRTLELGYMLGSAILLSLLISILLYWKLSEKTISVTSIRTFKVELLYWTTILISNTLGTALGDFLADDSGLGFMGGALLVGSLIALTVALYRFTRLSRVALFWIAFVLTRPFGATMGDVLTKTPDHGGLGFGTLGSSLVLLAVLVGVILYTMRRPRSTGLQPPLSLEHPLPTEATPPAVPPAAPAADRA